MSGARILVVAAHPDDEVLGCGGVIARHTADGDRVHILFMAEGGTARQPSVNWDDALGEIEHREEGARNAAEILGAEPPIFVRNPDNRLDSVALIDLAKTVEKTVSDLDPSIVYTHHGGDLNIDHRRVHDAVLTACRPVEGHPVKSIYAFEVCSSTEWALSGAYEAFRPNHFVDISEHLERKIAALEQHGTEMRPFPHPRSYDALRALARLRGATCGCPAAEAFQVLRQVR
jgi:LmbE family N-acetylglucosaminyl deacetylase